MGVLANIGFLGNIKHQWEMNSIKIVCALETVEIENKFKSICYYQILNIGKMHPTKRLVTRKK